MEASFPLDNNSIPVYLWYTRLDGFSNAVYQKYLQSQDEQTSKSVGRFRFEADRKRKLLGQLLIKKMLAEYSGHTMQKLQTTDHGKPYVVDAPAFNLSHSGNYVVLAFSEEPDAKIGVDVEHIKVIDYLKVGKTVYGEEELQWLAESPDQQLAFFRLWARKESVLKAYGSGFFAQAKAVNCLGEPLIEGEQYHFYPIRLDNQHQVCVAANRLVAKVNCIEISW